LLLMTLAAPPITARSERLEDTMMVRADTDRSWQIDGCRVFLVTEGVHSPSPVLMPIGISTALHAESQLTGQQHTQREWR
jgi:hypothetical protein